jgi:hypothetical protein
VDDLSPYDRTTVELWRRSYEELTGHAGHLPEAAMHAVLTGLRRHTDPAALFAAYEAEATADFTLMASLVPGDLSTELLWTVRDAAFYLRWKELTGGGR